MSSTVKPIPDGYQALYTLFDCRRAASAIGFIKTCSGRSSCMAWQALMAKLGMLN